MKQYIIIAMLSVASMLSAQTGWAVKDHPADQLLGVSEPYTSYIYTDDAGNKFIMKSNAPGRFGFISHRQSFHTDRGYNVTATIGLYDEDGQLIDSFQMSFCVNPENYRKLYNYIRKSSSYKKQTSAIIDHLRTGRGYVRIVSPLYGGGTFDMSVPCSSVIPNL